MIRSNGALSTLPIDPISCVQCLAEQKRRHRIPGSIAPELMRHYWELQKDQIKVVEDRINFQRETLNLANLLMTRSKFLATTYIQAGADPAKLVSFRQGMDASVFPSCIDKKQAVPYLRVGYIGQIAEHKGVHLLVDAIKKLPGIPVSAIMYGNKDAFPYYTRQLLHTANGDRRIEFAGPFHRQDLTKVMANLDILVVPSLCYENSPNVILEAFANQLPVVTSNLGGMAELVQHEKNGLLFKPGSAHDLANQIKRLVEEPELVEKFKQNIPMVKTIDQDVEELVMWYGKLIAKKDAAKVLDEQHSLS